MKIGACRITLEIPGNRSLKGKRRVVTSLCERLRRRYGVSVAEVDAQDLWQRAVIGMVTVSSSSLLARQMLESAVDYSESATGDAFIADSEIEVFEYD